MKFGKEEDAHVELGAYTHGELYTLPHALQKIKRMQERLDALRNAINQ